MPIRGFPNEGIVACFDEPNTSGAIDNIDAGRNAPVKNPKDHLSRLSFHSELFQYEVAAGPTNVTINHLALATKDTVLGVSSSGGGVNPFEPPSITMTITGNDRQSNILLLNHGLGYVPKFMVSLNGRRVIDGQIIQNSSVSQGFRRRVSVWANSSNVFLRDHSVAGGSNLPAISITYRVIVFRNSEKSNLKPLFSGGPSSPLILARGVIDGSKLYLRRTGTGDTPFALNLGPTIDVKNGGIRTATGGNVVSEPGYDGSFTAPAFVNVGVN